MVCKLPLIEVGELRRRSRTGRARPPLALATPPEPILVERLVPDELADQATAQLRPPEQRLLCAQMVRLDRVAAPRADELGAALELVFTRRFRACLVWRRERAAAKRRA